jgi:hypothetical protein
VCEQIITLRCSNVVLRESKQYFNILETKYVGNCNNGTVRSQVADRGDGHQIWRMAVNILNKQSRRVDKGWLSAWLLGEVLRTVHLKKNLLVTIYYIG